jgi:Ca2+-binding RTX toxin-like protein
MESAMAKIEGTNGNDILNGTASDDEIIGRKGNDILQGNRGDDSLRGDAGVDTYVWLPDDGFDTIISTGSAAHEDIIDIQGGEFYDYNFAFDGNDLLLGVTADGSYDFGTVGGSLRIKNFFTDADSINYLTADLGDTSNAFYNRAGDPDINARIYISLVTGIDQGDYTEVIYGTKHDDVITGGGGFFDRLRGLAGNDTISVEDGTKGLFRGGDGNDTLLGADQSDVLRGDAGNDFINGGEATDRIEFNTGPGGAFVNMSEAEVTYNFSGTDVTVASGQAVDNWGDLDTFTNVEDVRGSNFDDILIGSDLGNVVEGRDGNDLIEGRGGDDVLYGAGGDDTILGGDGDDYIDGGEGDNLIQAGDGDDFIGLSSNENNPGSNTVEAGAGDDFIDGGYGNDVLWGGPGNDTLADGGASDVFVFKDNPDEGQDTVIFFNWGDDQLDFSTFNFDSWESAKAAGEQVGNDVVFDFGDTSLTLVDVPYDDLGQNNFIIDAGLLV